MRILLTVALFFVHSFIFAQWTAVNNGLGSTSVTSMFAYVDTLMVGTDGGGIFKTQNDGENWTDVSGNIGSKNINDIRGGAGPKVIWAATDDGAYFTSDHADYTHSSAGLVNKNINYFWFGEGDNAKWAIGTNGAGLFTSPELEGPWNDANSGISGGGLVINDLSGYKEDELIYSIAATNDGFYISRDTLKTWSQKNGTLSGDALKVNNIFALGTLILAGTEDGYYASLDLGENWLSGITGEVINKVGISIFGPGGFYYLLGEKGYYSLDLATWNPIDLTGLSGGEITCTAFTSQYMYVGTESGGVFRKELAQVTAVEEETISATPASFALYQNFPNPFNPTTTINYSLQKTSHVQLTVFNTLGKKVAVLVDQRKKPGIYKVTFNANELPSGVYFYQLKTNDFTKTRKMILTK